MSSILHHAAERFSLRRRVSVPCQVVTEDDFRLLGERCEDLSMTGMQVRAVRYARVGTPVLISLRIPNSDIYLDTEGVVSRVAWGRRREDLFPAFGVSFAPLPALEASVLASRLRGLPPPLPARTVRVDYAQTVRQIGVAS